MGFNWIANNSSRETLVRQALQEVRGCRDEGVLDRQDAFFISELTWMARHGYLTKDVDA